MKRTLAGVVLAGTLAVGFAPVAAAKDLDQMPLPSVESGSASTGSWGGGVTTGSTGVLVALERLLFGGPLLCAAVGSAVNSELGCGADSHVG